LAVLLAALLLSSGIGPNAVRAQDTPAERTAASHPYAVAAAGAARRFGIPESWIWAVMRVESNGDVRAVSTAGAMGLMQIMPGTWASLRATGWDAIPMMCDNIMAGAAYLRAMHDRYGNAMAMLAAYNAGRAATTNIYRAAVRCPPRRAYLAKLASIIGGADDSRLAAAPPSDPCMAQGCIVRGAAERRSGRTGNVVRRTRG
jgi:soluble lytic murein transglycosylase-like protein